VAVGAGDGLLERRVRGRERRKKRRVGVEYAELTRFYGIDQFPRDCTPAFRRFWLKYSVPILKAGEMLEKGVDDDDDLYELVKLRSGEDAAAEALYQRRKSRLAKGSPQ
jgi:hypothetical protein